MSGGAFPAMTRPITTLLRTSVPLNCDFCDSTTPAGHYYLDYFDGDFQVMCLECSRGIAESYDEPDGLEYW